MNVIGSTVTPKRERVYHRANCIYEKRILPKNRVIMGVKQAEERQYGACKYCGGLLGEVRVKREMVSSWEKEYEITITYQKATDGLYIQTAIGFWKIIIDKVIGKYVLYHRNFFKEGMSFNQASQGGFHRQRDMKATKEIDAIIRYVAEHDKAKVIIMNDYRKLPKATEKQKKYYRQAENRARRQSHRRVDKLFAMIENEHPEYRKQAMM